eukprot:TRINITY_DN12018_c0_g1_i1.p1 TRINITY_DN12018_c0_g1~~TRINITY_DN12018_c0_g1_i1.p1  ORF type:complete len:997 (+),score=305.84 TRINITY_DN12018_c0_g1_i1:103-3093(+)
MPAAVAGARAAVGLSLAAAVASQMAMGPSLTGSTHSIKLPGPIGSNGWQWINSTFAVVLVHGDLWYSSDASRSWRRLVIPSTVADCQGVSECVKDMTVYSGRRRVFLHTDDITLMMPTDYPPGLIRCVDSDTQMALSFWEVKFHPQDGLRFIATRKVSNCDQYEYQGDCPLLFHYSQDGGTMWKLQRPRDAGRPPLPANMSDVWAVDWSNYHESFRSGKSEFPYDPDEVLMIRKHVAWLPTAGYYAEVASAIYRWSVSKGPVLMFDDQQWEPFLPDAQVFVHVGPFTFAAVSNSQSSAVELWVLSNKDSLFQRAQFPVDMTERSYTILDDSEGTVFANVYHKTCTKVGHWGNVYLSDASGSSYQLSLEYNRRNPGGGEGDAGDVDFHKIRGLDGVYVANRMVNHEGASCKYCQSARDCAESCNYETVMSWSKGVLGSWRGLTPPKKTSTGEAIDLCTNVALGKCQLHLHGVASGQDWIGGVVSKANSPGFIMASGNVGERLLVDGSVVDIFFSADAGQTWVRVAQGPHAYDWLDFGGFIVLAQTQQDTTHIMYSNDMGVSFKHAQFVADDKPVRVKRLRIKGGRDFEDPLAKMIIIEATPGGGNADIAETVVYHVDLTSIAGAPCERPGSDQDIGPNGPTPYEYFVPRGDMCFLGSKRGYVRKKRGAQCWNDESITFNDLAHYDNACPCTRNDFECAPGFQVMPDGTCRPRFHPDQVWWDLVQHRLVHHQRPPQYCKDQWKETKGYQRIPGDKCNPDDKRQDPAFTLDPIPRDCPKGSGQLPSAPPGAGTIILIILLVVAAGAAWWWGYNNNPTCAAVTDVARDGVLGICSCCADAARSGVQTARSHYSRVPQDAQLGEFDLDDHSDHEEIDDASEGRGGRDQRRAESPPWKGVPNGSEPTAAGGGAAVAPAPPAPPAPAPAAPPVVAPPPQPQQPLQAPQPQQPQQQQQQQQQQQPPPQQAPAPAAAFDPFGGAPQPPAQPAQMQVDDFFAATSG